MLIRSQDKKVLVNLDNATSLYISNKRVHAYYNDPENYDVVGEYSTEEKAIKALDMIQGTYSKYNAGHLNAAVFQMPQDSEVDA